MSSRDYFIEKKSWDKTYNSLIALISINLIVFVILNLLYLVYVFSYSKQEGPKAVFFEEVMHWFTLPSHFNELPGKPWTFFTYMFSHFGVLQILSNLLWLWGFGYILQDLAGNGKVIPVYIYGGLSGAFFFLLSGSFLEAETSTTITGAGTSIMCVVIATAALAPQYRVFQMLNGGIPIWIIAAIFVLIDVSVAAASISTAIAHIAAGIMGYFYVLMLKGGRDIGAWMNNFYNWLLDLFTPEKKYKEEKSRLYYKSQSKPFVKKPNLTQSKLDEILDKINQHGYEKLTEEEKEFLKKASEQDLQ